MITLAAEYQIATELGAVAVQCVTNSYMFSAASGAAVRYQHNAAHYHAVAVEHAILAARHARRYGARYNAARAELIRREAWDIGPDGVPYIRDSAIVDIADGRS